MLALLDTLEEVAPRLEFYPEWAKALFLVTLIAVLIAVLVFAVGYPAARNQRSDSG